MMNILLNKKGEFQSNIIIFLIVGFIMISIITSFIVVSQISNKKHVDSQNADFDIQVESTH